MKKFSDILREFNFKVPLVKRKGAGNNKIFCPKCGKRFLYYKEGNKCRHCGQEIARNEKFQTNFI